MMFRLIIGFLSKSSKKLLSIGTTLRFRAMISNGGTRARVVHPASLNVNGRLIVGEDFFCGPGFYYSSNRYSSVKIGSAVMFGPFVRILSGNHILSNSTAHMRYVQEDDAETKEIVIESGAWIGAGVTILSGARICEGSVIGANSTVSSYIPPFCIAVGHPAKMNRRRFSEMELRSMLISSNSRYSLEDVIEKYNIYESDLK